AGGCRRGSGRRPNTSPILQLRNLPRSNGHTEGWQPIAERRQAGERLLHLAARLANLPPARRLVEQRLPAPLHFVRQPIDVVQSWPPESSDFSSRIKVEIKKVNTHSQKIEKNLGQP